MASLHDHTGDGNIEPGKRRHHRYIEHHTGNLSVVEFFGNDGPVIRINNGEGDLTPEAWADLVRFCNSLRRGPKPDIQEEICVIMERAFAIKDAWPVKEMLRGLAYYGHTNESTIAAARNRLGVGTIPEGKDGGGLAQWVWTINQEKIAAYEARKEARRQRRSASRRRPAR